MLIKIFFFSEISQQPMDDLPLNLVQRNTRGTRSMNSNDFSDPLTFLLIPPAGEFFPLSTEISLDVFGQSPVKELRENMF